MRAFLWSYLALPLIHWLIVTFAIFTICVFANVIIEAKKLAKQSKALFISANVKMAEVSLQVTRADGTTEKPLTFRAYSNPLRRWAWRLAMALKKSVE